MEAGDTIGQIGQSFESQKQAVTEEQ